MLLRPFHSNDITGHTVNILGDILTLNSLGNPSNLIQLEASLFKLLVCWSVLPLFARQVTIEMCPYTTVPMLTIN